MPDFTLQSIAIFLALYALCIWCMLFMYNVPLCALHRGALKVWTKKINKFVFFYAPPVVFLIFHDAPWMQPILKPEGWNWRPVHVAAVLLAAYAIFCQLLVTKRLLFPKAVPEKISESSTAFPMEAKPEQWNIFLDRKWTHQPRAGERPLGPNTKPVPKYRRKIIKVKPHRTRVKMLCRPPFSWINQAYDLRLRKIELSLARLPKAFDGLRVLQLSDNHYGEVMSPAWYLHVVKVAREQQADLIVLTGDLVAGDHLYRQAVEVMAELDAPLGIYCVRGNHDFYTEPHIIAWWLEAYGIRLLSNRYVDLERDGEKIRLCGVEHPYVPLKQYEKAMGPETGSDAPFRLGLVHMPDIAVKMQNKIGADLILTGHTHGGQWRLPLIGPVIYPSIYGRRFDRGLQRLGKALLYNSAGFGMHTIPLRLNCPPEITLFTLRKKS